MLNQYEASLGESSQTMSGHSETSLWPCRADLNNVEGDWQPGDIPDTSRPYIHIDRRGRRTYCHTTHTLLMRGATTESEKHNYIVQRSQRIERRTIKARRLHIRHHHRRAARYSTGDRCVMTRKFVSQRWLDIPRQTAIHLLTAAAAQMYCM